VNLLLYLAVGLAAGFVIGLLAIMLRAYLRTEESLMTAEVGA
jgi:ABC-type uncharacterized transport system permease subunit